MGGDINIDSDTSEHYGGVIALKAILSTRTDTNSHSLTTLPAHPLSYVLTTDEAPRCQPALHSTAHCAQQWCSYRAASMCLMVFAVNILHLWCILRTDNLITRIHEYCCTSYCHNLSSHPSAVQAFLAGPLPLSMMLFHRLAWARPQLLSFCRVRAGISRCPALVIECIKTAPPSVSLANSAVVLNDIIIRRAVRYCHCCPDCYYLHLLEGVWRV
jgi:hypothetical protein